MNLTQTELAVVEATLGADAVFSSGVETGNMRTFADVGRERLEELASEYAGYIKNNSVARLPNVEEILDFLSDYPFFRVHGYFHNLTVEEDIEMYITGVEYVPTTGLSMNCLDEDDLSELKRRFTSLFYPADYLHIEDMEMAAEYHFNRLLETE